ncbi:hypothetical protein ABZW11_33710 [Nonomuraea sp. NPDC004580]|uniref:alcohol dehydrogenase catalytic domain-containing protein n=1 Tax=Nonomuraea sp. NPDC004580 TaxID=3154552 RepID=UPI0033BBFE2F
MLGDPPFVLGWDVSGEAAETGFGVTLFRPGDEVFGMPWWPGHPPPGRPRRAAHRRR